MSRNSKIGIAAILVVAIIAVGVGAYELSYVPPSSLGSPTVSIISPADGSTVTGPDMTVMVTSTNFNMPAQGHYHIYLDNSLQMAFDPTSTVTFTNVAPGTHTITVYLANPDHSLVSPQVSQTITITAVAMGSGSSPTASVISPASGSSSSGGGGY